MAEAERGYTMNVLEKILEEIENHAIEFEFFGVCDDYVSVGWIKEIIISHMDEVENDDWIPVEEGLPEEKMEVLCCFENGTVQSLWQNWKNDGLGDYFDDDLIQTEVIAWQPLPERYKGDSTA